MARRKIEKNQRTAKSNHKAKLYLRSQLSQRKTMLKYVIGFLFMILLFYWVYSLQAFEEHVIRPLVQLQTHLASGLLNVFSFQTSGANGMLVSEGITLDVAKGCDGMEPLALFIVGLLLVPFPMKYKLVGLAWGVGALFLLNVLRIAVLYVSKVHFPAAFDFLHLHGGFAIFTVITILIWAAWAQWATNQQRKPTIHETA